MEKTVNLRDPLSEFLCQHQTPPTFSSDVAADPQKHTLSIMLSRKCSWQLRSAGGSTMRNRAPSMRTMWRNHETSSTRGTGKRWTSGGSITMMGNTHDTLTTAPTTEHAHITPQHHTCLNKSITLKCTNIFIGSDVFFP
ncbi:hypothetical protein MHYP_G00317780 [Metynnis hypsauchen]